MYLIFFSMAFIAFLAISTQDVSEGFRDFQHFSFLDLHKLFTSLKDQLLSFTPDGLHYFDQKDVDAYDKEEKDYHRQYQDV